MIRIFDLDGVLVDTRRANLEAYRRAGIEPPADHHVRPWQEWCSPEDHERKGEHLLECLRDYGRKMPLMGEALRPGVPALVLSNASTRSLLALRQVFVLLGDLPIVWGVSSRRKAAWLAARYEYGEYWDDSLDVVAQVRRIPGWVAHHVTES